MSELLKVNACVYSRKGYEREINRDDFYMNGKFLSEHHLDNTEASMENRGTEYFFAVADHMEYSDDEQRANFSILRETGRFHEKITVNEGDLDYKAKELTTRVSETGKYLNSFLDMKNISEQDPERQMGFAGLLLSEGKAVGSSYGTGHIYFSRSNTFKQMTADHAKPQRLVELGIISDEEAEDFQEKYHAAEEETTDQVLLSEPLEALEGDKFLLISDGVYNALGEDNLEDILSMRSDSTYIAYRIINEAMKLNPADDLTAMVVRIERVTSSTGVVKKTVERPKAAALKTTSPPTYKHSKKSMKKYENLIYYLSVFFTAVLLILIIYLIIISIFKNVKEPDDVNLTPTTTTAAQVSPSPTEAASPEVTPPVTEVTPEPTVQPTQAPAASTQLPAEHTIKKGDSLTSITRKYYGTDDNTLVQKLGKYNNIPAPYNNIVQGQKIKIPTKEDLLKVEL